MTEREDMPARLRRISSHQITHERAAKVIEDMARELEALAPDRTEAAQEHGDTSLPKEDSLPASAAAHMEPAVMVPRKTFDAAFSYIKHCGSNQVMQGKPHPQQFIVDGMKMAWEASFSTTPTLGKFDQTAINAKAQDARRWRKWAENEVAIRGDMVTVERVGEDFDAEYGLAESPTEQLVAERVKMRGPHIG